MHATLAQLIALGVPMAIKTVYENGAPASHRLLPLTVTKRDRFYRVNGKIVRQNLALALVQQAPAQFSLD